MSEWEYNRLQTHPMRASSAYNVTGITVPNSGQFIPEEQSVFVVKSLNNFFSGNSTTETSK